MKQGPRVLKSTKALDAYLKCISAKRTAHDVYVRKLTKKQRRQFATDKRKVFQKARLDTRLITCCEAEQEYKLTLQLIEGTPEQSLCAAAKLISLKGDN